MFDSVALRCSVKGTNNHCSFKYIKCVFTCPLVLVRLLEEAVCNCCCTGAKRIQHSSSERSQRQSPKTEEEEVEIRNAKRLNSREKIKGWKTWHNAQRQTGTERKEHKLKTLERDG